MTVDDELVAAFERLIPQLSTSSLPPTGAELTDIVENPATVLFLARVDGAIVGSLTLAFYRIPTGLKAWIEDVVVDDAVRGRGVGAALNQAALAEARRRGSKDVSLTSRPVARGSEPPLPSSRVRRPRDEHVPLHVLIRVRTGRGQRALEVFGRLADLPVAVLEGTAAARRRLRRRRTGRAPGPPAGARPVCRRWPRGSPRTARSSPIAPSAATAASRTSASSADPARAISRSRTGARFDSCSPHDHAATSTTVGSSSCSAPTRSTSGWCAAISAARRRTARSGSASDRVRARRRRGRRCAPGRSAPLPARSGRRCPVHAEPWRRRPGGRRRRPSRRVGEAVTV